MTALKKAGRCNVATGNIDLATILDAALGSLIMEMEQSTQAYVNNNNPKRDRIIPLINVWGRTGL